MILNLKNCRVRKLKTDGNHTLHLYLLDLKTKEIKELAIYKKRINYVFAENEKHLKKLTININTDNIIELYLEKDENLEMLQNKLMRYWNIK